MDKIIYDKEIEKELDLMAVKPLAKRFYKYNYMDSRINFFFKDGMQEIFEEMFAKYLVGTILNKACDHEKMRAAHRKISCIKGVHFKAFKENLLKAMIDLSFSASHSKRIISLVEMHKNDILGRDSVKKETQIKNPHYSTKSCCSIQ